MGWNIYFLNLDRVESVTDSQPRMERPGWIQEFYLRRKKETKQELAKGMDVKPLGSLVGFWYLRFLILAHKSIL